MAGVDKIYGTIAEYDEFLTWVRKRCKHYEKYFYPRPFNPSTTFTYTISDFPKRTDEWLYFHCPIQWVKDRIEFQYNMEGKRMLYEQEKAHDV